MTAPTDVPTFPSSPAARSARADQIHRRLQHEHAIITRAHQELRRRDIPPSIALSRALYQLERGARRLTAEAEERAA